MRNILIFLLASFIVFAAANFVVGFAEGLASDLSLSVLIVGAIFTALATTLPEFMFSLNALKQNLGDVAIGDVIGTVIIDGTLLVGLTALLAPIRVQTSDILNVAVFTLMSVAVVAYFLKSGSSFTRNKAILMIILYLIFVGTEIASVRVA